mmetsp:Transcript_92925/g.184471  ORF Transcript_92925/g.184471 Transcript_92925/m.184471 type:complete len:263 (+) Transcript_92925:1611-2399(+)
MMAPVCFRWPATSTTTKALISSQGLALCRFCALIFRTHSRPKSANFCLFATLLWLLCCRRNARSVQSAAPRGPRALSTASFQRVAKGSAAGQLSLCRTCCKKSWPQVKRNAPGSVVPSMRKDCRARSSSWIVCLSLQQLNPVRERNNPTECRNARPSSAEWTPAANPTRKSSKAAEALSTASSSLLRSSKRHLLSEYVPYRMPPPLSSTVTLFNCTQAALQPRNARLRSSSLACNVCASPERLPTSLCVASSPEPGFGGSRM